MQPFSPETIWVYPTDTSFGLGVRADDLIGLEKLKALKKRDSSKFFSLMVRDWTMLQHFAEVPPYLYIEGQEPVAITEEFFTQTPRTIILKPKSSLPLSPFWKTNSVAFRVSTIPQVAQHIHFPITSTSANTTGEPPIFSIQKIRENFGKSVNIIDIQKNLPLRPASEIWDARSNPAKKIR